MKYSGCYCENLRTPRAAKMAASEKQGNPCNKKFHSMVNERIPSSFKYEDFITNISLLFFTNTAQKMKFSIKDFFSKCDQICRILRI